MLGSQIWLGRRSCRAHAPRRDERCRTRRSSQATSTTVSLEECADQAAPEVERKQTHGTSRDALTGNYAMRLTHKASWRATEKRAKRRALLRPRPSSRVPNTYMTMMMMDDYDDRFVTRLRAETRQLAQHVAREVGPSEAGLNANAAARGERGFSSRVSSRCDVARGFPSISLIGRSSVPFDAAPAPAVKSCVSVRRPGGGSAARLTWRHAGLAARRLGCSGSRRRLGGSQRQSAVDSAAPRRLRSSAAPQLGGSVARLLGGSAARLLGGLAAQWLAGSTARWLGSSAARRLGGSVVVLWLGTRIMRARARFARGPLYSRPKARQHSSAVDVRVI